MRPPSGLTALRRLGEVAGHPDPPDVAAAEAHYRQAMALAEELGMRPLLAHCHLGLGRLYRRADNQHQAEEDLTTARRMFGDGHAVLARQGGTGDEGVIVKRIKGRRERA